MIRVEGHLTVEMYGDAPDYLLNKGTEREVDLCDLIESFEGKHVTLVIRELQEED